MSDTAIEALTLGPDESSYLWYSLFNLIYVATAWTLANLAYDEVYGAFIDALTAITSGSLSLNAVSTETRQWVLLGVSVMTFFQGPLVIWFLISLLTDGVFGGLMIFLGDLAFWGMVIFSWIAIYWDDLILLAWVSSNDAIYGGSTSFTDTYFSNYPLYGVWLITKTVLNILGWVVAGAFCSGFEDHVNYMVARSEATPEQIEVAEKARCEDEALAGTEQCQARKKSEEADGDSIDAELIVEEEEEFDDKGFENADHNDSGEEDLFEPEVAEEETPEAEEEEPIIFKVLQ